MAAPTLLDYATSDWTDSSTTTETSDDLDWSAASDVIVVLGATEDNGLAMATPTGTGITLSALAGLPTNTGSSAKVYGWSGAAAGNGNSVLTSTNGASGARGIAAWAYSGSAGLGTPVVNVGAGITVSVTVAQDSSVVMVLADWNASADVTVDTVPAGGTIRQANQVSGLATFLVVEWANQASGTRSYGVANWTGTGTVSKAAVEVLGTVSVAVPWAPRQQARPADPGESYWMQPRRFDQSAPAPALDVPLLGPELGPRAATHARPGWSRRAPQQASQAAPAGTAYDPTLAPPPRTLAAYVDRREYPAQRSYPAAPDPVTPVGTGRLNAWWSDDPAAVFIAAAMPRQSDPSLLGTPADPLLFPAATARRAPATHADRRHVPAQRTGTVPADPATPVGTGANNAWWGADDWAHFGPAQRRPLADQSSQPAGTPFDPTLAGYSGPELLAATHRDRRSVPQQRAALALPDDTVIVGTGAMVAWWGADDTAAFTGQRRALAAIDAPATPFDPTLAGTLTARILAAYADRREVPLQRGPFAAIDVFVPVPLDPTLAGWLPLWLAYNRAATHFDRREAGQQRPYVSDPSFYPAPPAAADPLTLGGDTWRRYSLPAYADRREVPQQRTYPAPLTPDADPLLLVDDAQRRYLSPAYYDRREVPQQPDRRTLYFDAGPGLPPLTLAWGAGGAYWHLYNRPSRPRPTWPQSRPTFIESPCDGHTSRSDTGKTPRLSTGTTPRSKTCH